ncbi:hypothetical protein J3E68DRAFT_372346 [Trichoderma sp. SZMC 28012]
MYIVSAHLRKSKKGAKKSAPKLTRGLLIVPALSYSADNPTSSCLTAPACFVCQFELINRLFSFSPLWLPCLSKSDLHSSSSAKFSHPFLALTRMGRAL